MKTKCLLLLLILIFIFSCKENNKDSNSTITTTSSITTNLDTYFSALTNLKKFNGVVLAQKNGQPIFKKTYNIQSDPTSKLYVTENHQFDLELVGELDFEIKMFIF